MSEQQSSYRQLMKATSIFGGVQVFNILIIIIRSKVIAVLLGPIGMGVFSLFTTTISLIASLTNFGLETSAVKELSSAEKTKKLILATVIRRIVWITGLMGAIFTLVFSEWLSEVTFGNTDYALSFIWLSISLLLNQVSIGQTILLRGMRQLKLLAKAGMFGSFFGLIVTIPLYYFWGNKGVVPAIILTSAITLLFTWIFSKKINLDPIYVSKLRTYAESKEMIKMGFMISLSGIITLGGSYLVRIYISNIGGVNEVGLYYAGFAIITTYVGLIFTAMGTDYFPRLSSVAKDNKKCITVVNHQTEIAILILSPIILIFMVFSNWAVILLYSSKFSPINDMILWAAMGMFFKAVSWAIAYIFLAKGESKLFFLNELITNIYLLLFNIIGYKIGGLTGLGISFLISYILYLIQVFVVVKIKFDFKFSNEFYIVFIISILIAALCFIIVKIMPPPFNYIFGVILIIVSLFFSYIELDKRLGIKAIFENYKNKKNKNY